MAQLVDRSLIAPVICGSNPVISKSTINCIKTLLKRRKKGPGIAQFLKNGADIKRRRKAQLVIGLRRRKITRDQRRWVGRLCATDLRREQLLVTRARAKEKHLPRLRFNLFSFCLSVHSGGPCYKTLLQ